MRNIRIVMAIVVLALVATMTLAVSPASTGSKYRCPDRTICGWQHKNYDGDLQSTRNYRDRLGFANDEYSSLHNRHASTAWFSESSNCGGDHMTLKSGLWKNDLNNRWWWDWNDEISSVHRDLFYNSHGHC